LKLLSFLRSSKSDKENPEDFIVRVIDYMPALYKNDRQFLNSVEYAAHHEWALALDSLIELAVERGHYFSDSFWLGLADVADKFNQTENAGYCKQQVTKNKEDNVRLPFGWTSVKIDDTFQTFISKKLQEEWRADRRKKDKIEDLKLGNGVHLKSDGRSGYLYFSQNGKLAEIELELGISALIVYFSNTTTWILPKEKPLTNSDKQMIKGEIITWAAKTKNAIEFVDDENCNQYNK